MVYFYLIDNFGDADAVFRIVWYVTYRAYSTTTHYPYRSLKG